ncbi:MAG: glycerol-3-phosphate acyltransferase [Dehalococcoidales bacterium]|nr:glycerol-3-phosphate acyltransferase [Dehalococcoidales bacterium]
MIIMKEVIAIVIGYLLGSIPAAYISTRLATGKDIRQLGGGNVGGLNTFREVGLWPAVIVGITDVSKGAAAAAIAYWLLDLPPLAVMLTGLATVVGHNWMLWLKFSGGKGMGTTIGVLAVLFPVYGYWIGLIFIFAAIIIPYIITRNIAIAMGIALFCLPFITWLGMNSVSGSIMAFLLALIIGVKFFPTAKDSWSKAESKKDDFFFDNWRRDR